MIVVLSYDWYEQGTDPVIDWLIYHKANFVKITIQDLLNKRENCKININTGEIWINGKEISKDINVIWFRRFEDDVRLNLSDKFPSKQAEFEVDHEIRELTKFLFSRFKEKKWMPHYKGIDVNKLDVLYYANKAKIKVPTTVVCNNKNDLITFFKNSLTGIIIKPIRHSGYFIKEKNTYSIYTNSIDEKFINSLPENFTATLFQEKVKSKFEIRVFYLDGEFFATAIIINNNNNNTEADIKLSFESKDINWIPYKLPTKYEQEMHAFFQSINLNTCSFDVILTPDNENILLEINPVGQYSAPSNRCNYNIEEKIANWLIKNDK
ncbi:ATP-grasp domain-containing protein [Flavobacterium hiemivividum]|uniref:ATP-grasp domain-containing protein n=1 Tax=Flavobacterium hiemivividum TaxID=2541734 RepID=A0A4R5CVL0_9FLAO|nr:hypothetical protein [Flavobacterium hiemivividum]TDE03737.1 hypothetical protein E0F98_09520 [Flavobacterium hiemivividum]